MTQEESCEEFISRQAAIDALTKTGGIRGDALKALYYLPPVTPQPKIGHWIDTDNYYQRWKCSECGCHTRDAEPPFCPNCGIKMQEVKK